MTRKPFHAFEGVRVDEEAYARLGPDIEAARDLLRQSEEGGPLVIPGVDITSLLVKLFDTILPAVSIGPAERRNPRPETLRRALNALIVQAGGNCSHGKPPSARIEAWTGPGGADYFKCLHSPAHFWDADGNLIDRP